MGGTYASNSGTECNLLQQRVQQGMSGYAPDLSPAVLGSESIGRLK